MLKIRHFLVSLVILGALIVGGCTSQQTAANTTSPSASAAEVTSASSPTATETASVTTAQVESDPQMKDLPRLDGKATVVMTVKGSPITIEVDGTDAPISAGNFVDLVQRGVYDGLMFHRVVRDPQPFVVQGGDPQSKDPKVPQDALGSGSFIDQKTGSARYVPLEIKAVGASAPTYGKPLERPAKPILQHKRGAVAMARSQQPDSASSQFYFALADLEFLDGNYAVFGKVTSGMEVVDKVKQGDRIDSAKVTKGAENLKNGGK